MANWLHKTRDPVDYRISVGEPTLDDVPANWFRNPDVTAVASVETKYWQRPLADPVLEMTQVEKDAVDAAEAAAATAANRSGPVTMVDAVNPDGVRIRALVELFNKRDNYIINRLTELQSAMDSMKASVGDVDALRTAIPASWLPTATRSKADAVTDYKNDINAGNQDT